MATSYVACTLLVELFFEIFRRLVTLRPIFGLFIGVPSMSGAKASSFSPARALIELG